MGLADGMSDPASPPTPKKTNLPFQLSGMLISTRASSARLPRRRL